MMLLHRKSVYAIRAWHGYCLMFFTKIQNYMNNKAKFLLTLVIGMASLAILQPSTVCATTVSIGSSYGPYQVNLGGEFTFFSTDLSSMIANYDSAAKNQMGGLPNFQTFCVEGNEHIYTNTTYNVALNDHSVLSNNYLILGAAWLYSQFAQGTLTGYNYTGSRTTTADQLQRAIWHYMEDRKVRAATIQPTLLKFSQRVTSSATPTPTPPRV